MDDPDHRLRALLCRRAWSSRSCGGRCCHACENVGLFYALNHGVSDDTIGRAFAASRRFHALPLEQKLALRLDDNNIGYLAIKRLDTGHLGRAPGNPAQSERELFCHP